MFQRILLASIVAGVVAGIALTALQSGAVTALVLAAETYETAGADPALLPHRHGDSTHTHASGGLAHEHDGHALLLGDPEPAPNENRAAAAAAATGPGHGDSAHRHGDGDAWAPSDGIERTLWTAVSNVGPRSDSRSSSSQSSLGGAARPGARASSGERPASSSSSPTRRSDFGPSSRGAFAGGLLDRQLWWLLAVACSAVGVTLLLLAPRAAVKVGGAVLLAVPHLAGAPHPEVSGGLVPDGLADSFVLAAAATNAAFWLVLGVVAAVAFGRLSRS